MVVALLPLPRKGVRSVPDLTLPTHFTSISMWVQPLRLLPEIALPFRIAYCNEFSLAVLFGFVSFCLAAGLPSWRSL